MKHKSKFYQIAGLLIFILCTSNSCRFKVVKHFSDSGSLEMKYKEHRKTQKKNGYYRMYHENGQIALEMFYKNDKLHGEVKSFYPNGQIESYAKAEGDLYVGPFQYWFINGNLKQEGVYVNDKIEGDLKTYYPNGQLKEIVFFSNSVENGPYTFYYQDGQLKEEGHFLNGPIPDGLIKEYNAEGKLQRKRSCQAGTCELIWELESNND